MNTAFQITTFINAWRGYLVGHRRDWYPHQRANLLGSRTDIMIADPMQHLQQFRRVTEILQSNFRFEGQLWAWGMLPLPKNRMLLPQDFEPVRYDWGQAYCVWHSGHFSNHVQVLRFRRFCRRRRPRRRVKLEQRRQLPSRRVYRVGRKIRHRWRRQRRRGFLPARCYRLGNRQTKVISHFALLVAAYKAGFLQGSSRSHGVRFAPEVLKCSILHVTPPGYPRKKELNLIQGSEKALKWLAPRKVQNYLLHTTRKVISVCQPKRQVDRWGNDGAGATHNNFRLSRWLPFRRQGLSISPQGLNFIFPRGRYLRQATRSNFTGFVRLAKHAVTTPFVPRRSSRLGLQTLRRSLWIGGFTQRYRMFRAKNPRRKGKKIKYNQYQIYKSQPTVLPGVLTAGGLSFRQQAFITETQAINIPFVWFCGSNMEPYFTPWTVLWNQEKEHTKGLFLFFNEIWVNTQHLKLLRLVVTRLSLSL